MMKVKVRTEPAEPVKVEVKGQIYAVGDYKHYEGEYEVTPASTKKTLKTKNKVMTNDVTVKEIPYKETPNAGGRGTTVRIG